MSGPHDLRGSVRELLERAVYEGLEDGSYGGSIPECPGVIALGSSLGECRRELRSILEDWLRLGLELGRRLPVSRSDQA